MRIPLWLAGQGLHLGRAQGAVVDQYVVDRAVQVFGAARPAGELQLGRGRRLGTGGTAAAQDTVDVEPVRATVEGVDVVVPGAGRWRRGGDQERAAVLPDPNRAVPEPRLHGRVGGIIG